MEDIATPQILAKDHMRDRKLQDIEVSTIIIDLGRVHLVLETMVFDQHGQEIPGLTRQFPARGSTDLLDSAQYHRDVVDKIKRGLIDGDSAGM